MTRTITINNLSNLNIRPGEFVWIKYKNAAKTELGQIGSNGSLYNSRVFDEVNNRIYVHFKAQSFPSALDIDKIEAFHLLRPSFESTIMHDSFTGQTYSFVDKNKATTC